MMTASRSAVRLLVAAATVAAFGVPSSAVSAARPISGTMSFEGEISSVRRTGNTCRYAARLAVEVATTASGNPDGVVVSAGEVTYEGRVDARWTDTCDPDLRVDSTVQGDADITLHVASTAGGTPDGFRASGTGRNVATTASGTPEGFKFRGVFVPGRV